MVKYTNICTFSLGSTSEMVRVDISRALVVAFSNMILLLNLTPVCSLLLGRDLRSAKLWGHLVVIFGMKGLAVGLGVSKGLRRSGNSELKATGSTERSRTTSTTCSRIARRTGAKTCPTTGAMRAATTGETTGATRAETTGVTTRANGRRNDRRNQRGNHRHNDDVRNDSRNDERND